MIRKPELKSKQKQFIVKLSLVMHDTNVITAFERAHGIVLNHGMIRKIREAGGVKRTGERETRASVTNKRYPPDHVRLIKWLYANCGWHHRAIAAILNSRKVRPGCSDDAIRLFIRKQGWTQAPLRKKLPKRGLKSFGQLVKLYGPTDEERVLYRAAGLKIPGTMMCPSRKKRKRKAKKAETKKAEVTPYEQVDHNIAHHTPDEDGIQRIKKMRLVVTRASYEVLDKVPKGREQSLALMKLEEALFWANAGIARNCVKEPEARTGPSRTAFQK